MVQGEEGMEDNLYFIYDVTLVTGINKGFPANWLETYLVRKRYRLQVTAVVLPDKISFF